MDGQDQLLWLRKPIARAPRGVVESSSWGQSLIGRMQRNRQKGKSRAWRGLSVGRGRLLEVKAATAAMGRARFKLCFICCRDDAIRFGLPLTWPLQIFPKMRNYTANNKATSVGNQLLTNYKKFLLSYERAYSSVDIKVCLLPWLRQRAMDSRGPLQTLLV